MLNFLMKLYPLEFWLQFEDEMRPIFAERFAEQPFSEVVGLLRGAVYERWRLINAAVIAAGLASALIMQAIVYTALLTPAAAQPKQDPSAMLTAKAILHPRVHSAQGCKEYGGYAQALRQLRRT